MTTLADCQSPDSATAGPTLAGLGVIPHDLSLAFAGAVTRLRNREEGARSRSGDARGRASDRSMEARRVAARIALVRADLDRHRAYAGRSLEADEGIARLEAEIVKLEAGRNGLEREAAEWEREADRREASARRWRVILACVQRCLIPLRDEGTTADSEFRSEFSGLVRDALDHQLGIDV